jgi:hypothetical protein
MAGHSSTERIIGGVRVWGGFYACFNLQGDLLAAFPNGMNASIRLALGTNGLPLLAYDWRPAAETREHELRLAQIAADGTKAWERGSLAASRELEVSAMRIDPAGNIYAGGYFLGVATTGTNRFEGHVDRSTAYQAKFSPAGDLLWIIIPGGLVSRGWVSCIELDGRGRVLVAGAPFGYLKITPDGVIEDATTVDSLHISSMTLIRPGNIFIIGLGALDYQSGVSNLSATFLGSVLVDQPILKWKTGNDHWLTLFWNKQYADHRLERLNSVEHQQPTLLSGAITNGQFLEIREEVSATRFYRLRKP